MSESLRPHEPQHDRSPCPSPTARVYVNPCPLSQWCHPTISSSVIPFSSCLQSCPASGFFQMSQLFASGGQSIGVSASTSVLPINTQDWSPLGWTGWISLQSKGLSRVFSHRNMYIIKDETDHQPRLDTWDKCSDLVHWEEPEGLGREGGGRGIRMGNTCKSMADSCWYMTGATAVL